MNTRDFIKRRAKIERDFPSAAKRNAAMRRLVQDAGAAIIVIGNRVTGWRMPCGAVVCIKQRYRDLDAVRDELDRIRRTNIDGHRIPVRAYNCIHCRGFHLTSQPAQFDQTA